MDDHLDPLVARVCRGGTLCDMIEGLVHGKKKSDGLPIGGEIFTGGVDLVFDVWWMWTLRIWWAAG